MSDARRGKGRGPTDGPGDGKGVAPVSRRGEASGEEPVPPHLRKVVDRAVRRLEVFEWIILFGVGVFSIAGGALVAVLASDLLGAPFRAVWVLSAVAFFGIPGWLVLWRNRD